MIDNESLLYALKETIEESLWEKYDFETIVNNAELAYDETAVQVKAADFVMYFDLINYDLINIGTGDINDE